MLVLLTHLFKSCLIRIHVDVDVDVSMDLSVRSALDVHCSLKLETVETTIKT